MFLIHQVLGHTSKTTHKRKELSEMPSHIFKSIFSCIFGFGSNSNNVSRKQVDQEQFLGKKQDLYFWQMDREMSS